MTAGSSGAGSSGERCGCGQRTDVCARYGCHEYDGAPVVGSGEPLDLDDMAQRYPERTPGIAYKVPELIAECRALRAKLALPCGSCHPCTNWRDEEWRRAGRKPPYPHEVDEMTAEIDALRAENARLRMDLTDWQEQAEIRSLGVQMASEQRDQVIAVANERADEIDNLRSENARLTAEVADQRMVIASHRDVLHLRKEQINAADGFTAQAAQRALDAAARAAAAEARLAAVLALCDLSPHYLATDQVRAAARGESDQ